MNGYVRDYQGLIALNNTGVALIEGKGYDLAIQTLQDAGDVLKMLLAFQATDEDDAQADGDVVTAKLRRATRHLAKVQNTTAGGGSESSSSDPSSCNSLVFSSGNDFSVQATNKNGGGAEDRTPLPIRIETQADPSFSPEESDLQLESAIILYNIGVAHISVSRTARMESRKVSLRTKALKLFSLSATIIDPMISTSEDDAHLSLLILLKSAVWRNLVHALEDSGDFERAKKLRTELVRMLSV